MEKEFNNVCLDITVAMSAFQNDLNKYKAGNKTAGRRCRKQTLEMEKLFKQFRKMSVALSAEGGTEE